ncbi:MAG: hypothetical protein GY943_18090 [Chloroflexi bacterium]|nr:hypothetical protein [Chloroflexota bacterium]
MKHELNDLDVEKENQNQNENWGRMGGVFMIAMGGIFLLSQSGIRLFGQSPWVLFAMLPVIGVSIGAWRMYVGNGRKFSRQLFYLLLWGLFPFAYVAAAIFDINASLIWPVAIILMGVGIMAFPNR